MPELLAVGTVFRLNLAAAHLSTSTLQALPTGSKSIEFWLKVSGGTKECHIFT